MALKYNQKFQELLVHDLDATGEFSITLTGTAKVDKIRITVASQPVIINTAAQYPGMLVWSNLIDDYIGSVGEKYVGVDGGGNPIFHDRLQPSNGLEVFYPCKAVVAGTYRVKLFFLDGRSPAAGQLIGGTINILIEYYCL